MKSSIKIVLVMMMFRAFTTTAMAQTTKEWLSQKKTQKEYLLRQIAALQIYKRYVQQGYKIAQSGLNTIGKIKDGDFNIHKAYFNSLLQVNPNIKKYGRVKDIMALHKKTVLISEKDYASISSFEGMQDRELKYIKSVYERVVESGEQLLEDLTLLISDGNYKMSDDERIQQIDQLYLEMQDILGFTQTFGKEAIAVGISREMEKKAIEKTKRLNDIKTP